MHAMPISLSPSLSSMNLFTPSTGPASKAAATGSGSGLTTAANSTGTGLDDTTTGTTFLSLLVDELQNQDPTAPMDSTAMVGQMISLNQLDQLVSINSELGASSTSSSSSSGSGSSSDLTATSPVGSTGSQSSSALIAAKNALLNSSSLSSSVSAASLAASNPNTTLDLSSFTNQFGGK